MNGIDWDKAPKGYPLWLEFKSAEHRAHSGWYRKVGNYFKGYYGAHWPEYRTGQFFNVHYKSDKHLINDAYLAPLLPSPTWSGEGLPSVGAACEYFDNQGMWHPAVMSHIGSHLFIVKYQHPEKGEQEACMYISGFDGPISSRLRPIRTPEQIAADEREAAIKAMCEHGIDAGDYTIEKTCAALYDAGLRFTEPKQ